MYLQPVLIQQPSAHAAVKCAACRLPAGVNMQPGRAKASDNLQSLDVDVQLLIFGSVPVVHACFALLHSGAAILPK